MRSRNVVTSAVLAVLLLGGCGDGGTGTVAGDGASDATSSAPATTTTLAPVTTTAPASTAPTATATPASTAPASTAPASTAPVWEPSAADPLRVLLEGDSVLYDASPGIEASLESTGVVDATSNGTPGVGLAAAAAPDIDWRPVWQLDVDTFDPDVVVLMTGGWDIFAFRRLGVELTEYAALVEEAVTVLTARGADLLVVGMPPQDLAGSTPEDSASDAALRPQINEVFARVAAAHPGVVAFLPLDTVLGDAEGRYRRYLPAPDGTLQLVRKQDGLHVCPDGAVRLGEAILDGIRTWWALPAVDPAYRSGAWRTDPRYDTPPGTCVPDPAVLSGEVPEPPPWSATFPGPATTAPPATP